MIEEWMIMPLAFVALVIWVVIFGKRLAPKTHDVECKFRTGSVYHGDLDQVRRADGTEEFEMPLYKLQDDYTGPVRMLKNGQHVADFEAESGEIDFEWEGEFDANTPLFEVGDEVVLELGPHRLAGVVEPD